MSYRRFQFAVFVLMFVFLIAETPVSNMVWDADGYLNSSIAIVTGVVNDSEQLYFRGVFTSVVYLIPSFVGLKFLEPTVFGTYIYVLVLVQNALIVSLIGSYMLPRLLELFIPRSKQALIATASLTVYALQAFTSYSLIDVFAVALLIPAIYLLASDKPIVGVLYGLIIGISVNLRPSYLASVIFLVFCAAIIHRYKSVFFLSGLLISHVPQVIFNWLKYKSFSFFALGSGELATSNFNLAASTIRVDTQGYPKVGNPQALIFCDKRMLDLAKRADLESTYDMLLMFIKNPAATLVFQIKKVSAAIWWPVTSPYYDHNPLVNTVFGSVISLVVVFGTSMLIFLVIKSKEKKRFLGFVAVYFGFFVNIVVYHNEPRYALPIVIASISGFVLLCMRQFSVTTAIEIPEMTRNWKWGTFTAYSVVAMSAMVVLVGDRGFASLANCS